MSKRTLPYHLLDVFTDTPFGGNALAVFPDADDVPTALMQQIARELNLSESTFIQKAQREGSDCTVRIFTPLAEVPMAGHPTLGTAHAILSQGLLEPRGNDCLVFDEGVGPITVDIERDASGAVADLWMHQKCPEFGATLDPATAAKALSLASSDLLPDMPVQIVSCGLPFILVPLRDLDAVGRAKVRPDVLDKILSEQDCAEVLAFTPSAVDAENDVHCRMFAPRFGVPEDPATGSAHGPLGCYLVHYQLRDAGLIRSEQGIEMGRPSLIQIRLAKEGDKMDVAVGGRCVEMGQGALSVDMAAFA